MCEAPTGLTSFSSGAGSLVHTRVQKSRIWEICNLSAFFRLQMTRIDESVVCAQRIAVAVSVSRSFVEDVAYILSRLRMQHLKLKEEHQLAIEAICHGDDLFA